MRQLLAVVGSVLTAPALGGGVVLISLEGVNAGGSPSIDFVYDASRDLLFVSSPQGAVDRIHVSSRELLPRWWVGEWATAMDMAPSGDVLLVCDADASAVVEVDADTGAVSLIEIPGEDRPFDIVALSSGIALFTPYRPGAGGPGPLRQLDLDTHQITTRGDVPIDVYYRSLVWRSPNRDRVFLHQTGTDRTWGCIFDAPSDSFLSSGRPYYSGAFSPDGKYLATQHGISSGEPTVQILDSTMGVVSELYQGPVLAFAFSPDGGRLYFADRLTGELVTVSTADWSEISRVDTKYSFDSAHRMAVSDDGLWLFVEAEDGVLMIDLSPGEPCLADFNYDGSVDVLDVLLFLNRWVADHRTADCNNDGLVDTLDVLCFLTAWESGC